MVRYLDLLVLAIGLPVFVAAGLPLLGWGATTFAWLAARGVQLVAERRAERRGDRRAAMTARAAALIARLYVVGLTVLAVGIADREAGLAAGVLAVAVFTVHFATQFFGKEGS